MNSLGTTRRQWLVTALGGFFGWCLAGRETEDALACQVARMKDVLGATERYYDELGRVILEIGSPRPIESYNYDFSELLGYSDFPCLREATKDSPDAVT